MSTSEMVQPTQGDIAAADRLIRGADLSTLNRYEQYVAEAFARHRLAGMAAGREEAAKHLEAEAAIYRISQGTANGTPDKLYRMGQKDACLLQADAIRALGDV